MNIDQLNDRFGIQDQVTFVTCNGGLPFINIRNQSASAVISLYGGQILSFKPVEEKIDMLFLSKNALYEDGKAIRGGIPLCWPWFGPDPEGLQRPNHGFARNHFWTVTGCMATGTETKLTLQFTGNRQTEQIWQQPFALTLEFIIAQTLHSSLATENTGDKPFSITQAFHTYFNVGDINRVQVSDLDGCPYIDKLDQGKEKIQTGAVTVAGEIERIYENSDGHVILNDLALNRRMEITSENGKASVVWNPWHKAMPDLDKLDYQRFVCIETGNIAFDSVQILPGEAHKLATSFKILRD